MLGLKLGHSVTGLGKTGQNIYALSFNGTDESVTVNGINSDISVTTGTISAWVKFNAMSGNGIILKAQNDSNNNINLHYNNAKSKDAKKNHLDGRPYLGLPSDYKNARMNKVKGKI